MAKITKGIPSGFLGKAGMVVGAIGEVQTSHRFSQALKNIQKGISIDFTYNKKACLQG